MNYIIAIAQAQAGSISSSSMLGVWQLNADGGPALIYLEVRPYGSTFQIKWQMTWSHALYCHTPQPGAFDVTASAARRGNS
jgi:hypothetical protein